VAKTETTVRKDKEVRWAGQLQCVVGRIGGNGGKSRLKRKEAMDGDIGDDEKR